MNHEIVTFCNCGCGDGFVVKFRYSYDGHTYVYLETLTSGCAAKQGNIIQIIKSRIKAAWFMLVGKEYLLHDVMLDKHQWNKLVDMVNKTGKFD